ncbi:TetR family transcriptional regulator [Micromonospora sp. Llam0]|uniref:TetR/AcrR family transcriptional regulator n=1 Tax=Micromonospora sp. Llam0 TaxID=2485143 RepID=UPI000F4A7D8E|nr:TetR/AcrR family transcriptional regulator [Micromonospora sp. Llam0]ROO61664.1 TetR family transcriptional regulator [Micromonospora sp. Llam0]
MKTPPADLARRLLDISEQVLHGDPAPRLEDIAGMVGASRATLYYYFAGRDDLLAFLLTAHAHDGAQAVQASIDHTAPPAQRLRAMVAALATYLSQHPGICAGLLSALGSAGRMTDVMAANDRWIAGPLRELLAEAGTDGAGSATVADTANAVLGALLLAVLGRSVAGADPTDARFRDQLTDQVLHGILTREPYEAA